MSALLNAFKRRLGAHDLPFLRSLIEGFNYYDEARVREIGPDRVVAEWIVRCEGKVMFDRSPHMFSDYNILQSFTAELDPRKESGQVHVTTIDATDSSISGSGCRHFAGLHHLRDLRLVRCKALKDNGLRHMADAVGDTLLTLHIESCPKVTNSGLKHLAKLQVLKSLSLQDLRSVWKPETVVEQLRAELPTDCKITYQGE